MVFSPNLRQLGVAWPAKIHRKKVSYLSDERWKNTLGYSWGYVDVYSHREHGGTPGMVPLIINPIYTFYSGYLLGISPFKGLLGGLKQLGYHPRVPPFSL